MQANWAQITPSVADLLHPDEVPTLKTLILSGESMSRSHIARWAGHVNLINAYGPAECSVLSTSRANFDLHTDPLNIGHPTGDCCCCWVTDRSDSGRLAPLGTVGELLIEGPILSQGYLNDAERTNSAFITDPSWMQTIRPGCSKGKRLYRTGDLVQYQSDGSLIFLGRKDTQVKLRGQRLELSEVEHYTRQCLKISSTVLVEIVTPADVGSSPIIVAFVLESSQENENHSPENLFDRPSDTFRAKTARARVELQEQLPEYMIPTAFVSLAYLPLMKSGKADRRQLRERASALTREELCYTDATGPPNMAASNPVESTLHRIFLRVLNQKDLGIHDSFFAVGGDSISAMRVVALCREEHIATTVRDIFRYKTISRLARSVKITGKSNVAADEELDTTFDLSPIQQMFFNLRPSNFNHFNQSFFLRISNGSLRLEDISRVLSQLVRHHSMLRARFHLKSDGSWGQMITDDVVSSYQCNMHDVAAVTDEEVQQIIATSHQGLNIEHGPLLRANLINEASGDQYLFVVAHHLVIDLVSWRIILDDMEQILRTGGLSAQKTITFQRWCHLQMAHTRSNLTPSNVLPLEIETTQDDYWGMAGKTNKFEDSLRLDWALGVTSTQILLTDANAALDTQPVDIFQAALFHAFVKVFKHHRGKSPVIFNEGHGREPWDPSTIDLSRTVGWFTTLWPVPIAPGEDNDIVDVVKRVKDGRRQTPSNGLPYFSCRYLHPQGKKAFAHHSPIEILFNYAGIFQQLESEESILRPFSLTTSIGDVDPANQRFALFDVSASVRGGSLRFNLLYNRHMQHHNLIERWMCECQRSLEEAAHKLVHTPRQPTLSDFPLLGTTYAGLHELVHHAKDAAMIANMDEIEDIYPCSSLQETILMAQRENSACYKPYIIWEVVPLSGRCSVQMLQTAWKEVVERHAALRTYFVHRGSDQKGSSFYQIVLKRFPCETAVIQCADDDLGTHRPRLPPFDATRAPHSMIIQQTGSGRTLMHVRLSHAVVDAASLTVLLHDLHAAIADGKSFLDSGEGPLYSSYISYLQEKRVSQDMKYWNAYLRCVQPCHLPTDNGIGHREPPRLQSTAIPLPDTAAILKLCQRLEVTVAVLFKSVWTLTLCSILRTRSICFGYLVSSRQEVPLPESDRTVGPFLNHLVFSTTVDPTASFASVAHTVQKDNLESIASQFSALEAMAQMGHSTPRSLYNTLVNHRKHSRDEAKYSSSAIQFNPIYAEDGMEFDVVLAIDEMTDDLKASLDFWDPGVSQGVIDQVRELFSSILRRCVEDFDHLLWESIGMVE